MTKRYKFKSSLIGYDKGHVNSYLESLTDSNAMKLDEVKRRISDCASERDKLNAEFMNKQKELEEYKKSRKYMEFALKRTESTVDLINVSAQKDLKELDEISKKKIDEYDKEIERLSGEINDKQEQLSFLVRRAAKQKQAKTAIYEETVRNKGELPVKSGSERQESHRRSGGSSFWDDDLAEEISYKKENSPRESELNARDRVKPEESYDRDDERLPNRDIPSSPALSADINQVRNKYLVGKVAGEDLVAKDGSVIIKKGSVISAETVGRAEEEGKLAELIINMVLPGMES